MPLVDKAVLGGAEARRAERQEVLQGKLERHLHEVVGVDVTSLSSPSVSPGVPFKRLINAPGAWGWGRRVEQQGCAAGKPGRRNGNKWEWTRTLCVEGKAGSAEGRTRCAGGGLATKDGELPGSGPQLDSSTGQGAAGEVREPEWGSPGKRGVPARGFACDATACKPNCRGVSSPQYVPGAHIAPGDCFEELDSPSPPCSWPGRRIDDVEQQHEQRVQ